MRKGLSKHQKELLHEMRECKMCHLEFYVRGDRAGRWEYSHPQHGPIGILRSTGSILLDGGYLEEVELNPRWGAFHVDQKVFYRIRPGVRVK